MKRQTSEWGNITPDGYDHANREALHVLNVNFIGEANRNRAVKFTCARVVHFHRHLPEGSSQRILFDLRGQAVTSKSLDLARQAILQEASKHGIPVIVEFLTN